MFLDNEQASIFGTCNHMCPVGEIRFRSQKGLVHKLEQGNCEPEKRFVKSFQRSAAGVIVRSNDVRPFDVLSKTVNYLLGKVLLRQNMYPFSFLYGFIDDRLRAVRQDMVVQQVHPENAISLLEPMVRFYAFSHFKLIGVTKCVEFDPVLNHNCLLECLKSLLRLYDCVQKVSKERVEMEAMYLVLSLGNPTALRRSLQLPNAIRAGILQDAERISLDWYLGNYFKVTRSISKLPLLLQALLYAAHLPTIRKFALMVMSCAFNSKTLVYPISQLKDLLLYEHESQIIDDVQNYGLTVDGSVVHFMKSKFDDSQKEIVHKPLLVIEEKINRIMLPEMILSSYLDMDFNGHCRR